VLRAAFEGPSADAANVDATLRREIFAQLESVPITTKCRGEDVISKRAVSDAIAKSIVRLREGGREVALLTIDGDVLARLRAACGELLNSDPPEAWPVFVGGGRADNVDCADTHDDDRVTLVGLYHDACFGRCPTYSLAVYADGTVEYDGKKWVPVLGEKTAHIDNARFRELARAVNASGFFCMAADYERGITDMPAVYVTVRKGDQRRQIKDYDDAAPEKLAEIERMLDALTAQLFWPAAKPEVKP
jgi:hypothetical protein